MSSNWDAGWDLSIDNHNGQRILDIEVTTKLNASPENPWRVMQLTQALRNQTSSKMLS